VVGDEAALKTWLEGELAATEDGAALIDLLRACLPEGAVSPESVVEAVKLSFSTGELRERLALDFAAFNASLMTTGSAPDVDLAGQTSQLAYFVEDYRIAIGDALRNMVAPTVLQFEPDERYKARARGIVRPATGSRLAAALPTRARRAARGACEEMALGEGGPADGKQPTWARGRGGGPGQPPQGRTETSDRAKQIENDPYC
jgi:hypothetical protein